MAHSLSDPKTFTEILRWRAEKQPDQRLYSFLPTGECVGPERIDWTFGELDARARAIAAELQKRRLQGERVLLIFQTGLDYIAAFFGCLYARVLAVPVAPPDPSRLSRAWPQLLAIVRASGSSAILTTRSLQDLSSRSAQEAPELGRLPWIASDQIPLEMAAHWTSPAIDENSVAFLLYTSGSTGAPKGVIISHRNLVFNSAAMHSVSVIRPTDVFVSWIPHFHTMGMLGGILQPLYGGFLGVLMSPSSFLQRPLRWIEAISHFKGSISPCPNFALDLCARRFMAEPSTKPLDLSAWRLAGNGAEHVRSESLDLFTETFEPYGFRREALYPGYGLAEATFMVSGGSISEPPVVKTFQKAGLAKNRVIETADGDVKRMVGCGRVIAGQTIAIVNPETLVRCRSDEIGEIWVSGPSIAQGYWNLPQETEETFRGFLAETGEGPFLRTGDLGFLQDGELFINGRLKDVIIIRGENRYPQDIEANVEKVDPAIRATSVIAFSADMDGEERLVIAAETDENLDEKQLDDLLFKIREAVSQNHNIHAHDVALLPPGSIPKTPTGKIQRQAFKGIFLSGQCRVSARWRNRAAFQKAAGSEGKDTRAHEGLDLIDEWVLSKIADKLHVSVSDIDLAKPLASYGLDSLSAVELAQGLEEKLGAVIPLSVFFESGSVGEILPKLKKLPKSTMTSGARIDLNREAALDDDIRPKMGMKGGKDIGNPKAVFLTGATGFVGAYLVRELVDKTGADIYCLVRVGTSSEGIRREKEAKDKIRRNLESFSLWDEKVSARVIGVPGDLSQPLLGLSEDEFGGMSERVDAIYHNGASVNFIYPYRDLKASNVFGTQEILRLACQSKLKPVHYISTVGVFPGAGAPDGGSYTESSPLVLGLGLLNGYSESKWVAEKVLEIARGRGVPVSIYRLGEVVGSEKTGALKAGQDVNSNMIKGALQMGRAPRLDLNWYLVRVDYVAGAVVHLSLDPLSVGRTFHLTNPIPISLSEVYETVSSLGYPIEQTSYDQWLQDAAEFAKKSPKTPLASFMPFLRSEAMVQLGHAQTQLKIDCFKTMEALEKSGLSCPPPGELLKRLLAYLEGSRFLENVKRLGANAATLPQVRHSC